MRLTLYACLALVILAGLLPVAWLLAQSLPGTGGGGPPSWTLLLGSGAQAGMWRNTLLLALLSAGLATLLGAPLGVILGRTDFPWRRFFLFLFLIPLCLPPYVLSVAWFSILGREGLVSQAWGPAAAAATSTWFFGLPGCILVLATAYLPLVLILTAVAARSVPRRQEEAARLVAPWRRVLAAVTLPQAASGVALGFILVFLLAAGEYSVPMYLRVPVFPVESLTRFAAFYDFRGATILASPVILLALLAVGLERIMLRRAGRWEPIGGGASGYARIPLGKSRWPVGLVVASAGGLLVVLPLGSLLYRASAPGALAEAFRAAAPSLWRSLQYAAGGATVLLALGLGLGYAIRTRVRPAGQLADALGLFLFTLPGTVIGMGLVLLWNRPATALLYSTPAILLVGYVAQYTGLAGRMAAAVLARVPPSLEEAARVAGAGWARRMARIVIPAARPGLIGVWVAAFIFCLRDTGASMVVYPPGGETLPVRIMTLMANGAPALIAALCLLLIAVILAPLALSGILIILWRKARAGREPAFKSLPRPGAAS
jgi:iron(III) transport system permease protein